VTVSQRIEEELALLREYYEGLEYIPDGRWVRIPDYPLPPDWNRRATDVAFQIQAAHPGTAPYGIYVPTGLQYKGAQPKNYQEPAATRPPFPGTWGVFSWQPEQWQPKANIRQGANLLNWVQGFAVRFREGL